MSKATVIIATGPIPPAQGGPYSLETKSDSAVSVPTPAISDGAFNLMARFPGGLNTAAVEEILIGAANEIAALLPQS